jgi:hypothetical protein
MNHLAHSKNTSISRSLMAGLACGIAAAALSGLYTYIYRKATDYSGSMYFEPLLIFFAFPVVFLIAAVIYFEMADYMKKGGLLFIILIVSLTIIGAIFGLAEFEKGKQGLLLGYVLITGVLLALVPFLATHAKIFMDKDEFAESDD